MKKWILTMFTRFGDLLVKLVSVKVLVACVITWYALRVPGETGLLVVSISWMLVVGFRYAEKAMNLVKGK